VIATNMIVVTKIPVATKRLEVRATLPPSRVALMSRERVLSIIAPLP